MKAHSCFPHIRRGFSLIETLCAMALIILLAGLISPTLMNFRSRAEAISCASNLRQIGVAMALKVQDNNNTFPKVETNPADPIYPPSAGALPLGIILQTYGITQQTLCCRADRRGPDFYGQRGSSYEWLPIVDGEISVSPTIYLPSGTVQLPLSRLPMAADFSSVHLGGQNVLFADGHVRIP